MFLASVRWVNVTIRHFRLHPEDVCSHQITGLTFDPTVTIDLTTVGDQVIEKSELYLSGFDYTLNNVHLFHHKNLH